MKLCLICAKIFVILFMGFVSFVLTYCYFEGQKDESMKIALATLSLLGYFWGLVKALLLLACQNGIFEPANDER